VQKGTFPFQYINEVDTSNMHALTTLYSTAKKKKKTPQKHQPQKKKKKKTCNLPVSTQASQINHTAKSNQQKKRKNKEKT